MSIMLIGDVLQTLFLWRSAAPDLLVNMDKILPGAQKGYVLSNYRSPKQLVLLSNYYSEAFLELGMTDVKPSDPFHPESQGCLSVRQFDNTLQEVKHICQDIRDLNKKGVAYKDISVISRTNKSLLDIESGLISMKIPYVVKFDARSIMNQSPFKAMYSLYSMMFNSKDINSLCEFVLPVHGIGPKFLDSLKKGFFAQIAQDPKLTVFNIDSSRIKGIGKQAAILERVLTRVLIPLRASFLNKSVTYLGFNAEAFSLFDRVFAYEGSNYDKGIQLNIDKPSFMKTSNILNNIYNVLSEDIDFQRKTEAQRFQDCYESLSLSQNAYEDHTELSQEEKKNADRVSLNTIHSFKGQEADYIFAANLRSIVPAKIRDFESLCVFYVTITRAKKKLIMTSSENVLTYANVLQRAPQNPLLERYISGINRLKEELEKEKREESCSMAH